MMSQRVAPPPAYYSEHKIMQNGGNHEFKQAGINYMVHVINKATLTLIFLGIAIKFACREHKLPIVWYMLGFHPSAPPGVWNVWHEYKLSFIISMHICIIMSKIRLNQGRLLHWPLFIHDALTICYKITLSKPRLRFKIILLIIINECNTPLLPSH